MAKAKKEAPKCKWINKFGYEIDSQEQLNAPDWAIGFVYSIVDKEDRRLLYIGKKNILKTVKTLIGKRETAKNYAEATDKRTVKKVKRVIKQTDWLYYNSSNKELAALIQANPDRYEKKILEFSYSSLHLTYLEMYYMMVLKVLEDDLSYNDNILGKIFKDKLKNNKPNEC